MRHFSQKVLCSGAWCGLVGHMPPNTTNTEPDLLSIKEVARRLSVTPWTVYQLADRGQLESRYIGKRRNITVASYLAYLDSLPSEPKSSAS